MSVAHLVTYLWPGTESEARTVPRSLREMRSVISGAPAATAMTTGDEETRRTSWTPGSTW
nr:hypothetical protein [Streptomyces avermitilis]